MITWSEWQDGEGKLKLQDGPNRDQGTISDHLQKDWNYSCSCPFPIVLNNIYQINYIIRLTYLIINIKIFESSYLPSPGIEFVGRVVIKFIKMDWSEISEEAPSFWYHVSFYFNIFQCFSHDASYNISHSQCLCYDLMINW